MFLWSDVTPQAAWAHRESCGENVADEVKPSHKTVLEILELIHIVKPRTLVMCKQLSCPVVEEYGKTQWHTFSW